MLKKSSASILSAVLYIHIAALCMVLDNSHRLGSRRLTKPLNQQVKQPTLAVF